jgi:transposase
MPGRSSSGRRPSRSTLPSSPTSPARRGPRSDLPDEATRQLTNLVARRRQIVEMMAAEGQRGRRVDHRRVARSIARVRKTLEAELAELGDQVRGSPLWREKQDLLGGEEEDGAHGCAACLVAAGKPKMVALIATARKLLTILNAIIHDNSQNA